MSSDLENLRPDQLFALANNPACVCRQEAVNRLRAIKSPLARHFDPKPEPVRIWTKSEPPLPVKPADPKEAISLLREFPVDRLMDIVSAAGVYSKEIRLEAARLVKQRSPMQRFSSDQRKNAADAPKNPETQRRSWQANMSAHNQFDRKIAIRMENDQEFARMMKDAE